MRLDRLPAGGPARYGAGRVVPGAAGWMAAGVVLGVAALLSSLLAPAPLVLLATGCVLVIAGIAVAATLLMAGLRMGHGGTAGWDAAAALVFLGFAAALLTDTGAALTALAELRSR